MDSPIKAKRAGTAFNLFFVEMMIVLLFFGIASAVILKTFVTADRISRESSRLEKMSFCAQTAAETFSRTGNLSETAEVMFGIKTDSVSEITVPLDESCSYSPADSDLLLTMTVCGEEYDGRLLELRISFSDKDGGVLYEVSSGAFVSAAFTERTESTYE